MKTQQELMQAYWGPGGTVDMVRVYNTKHLCDVKPWECVKCEGNFKKHPEFTAHPEAYTFALTILYDDKRKEHRPVWVGSELYANNCTKPLTIKGKSEQWGYLSVGECTNYAISILSWNPPTPKRTFKLNDLELPCPEKRDEGGFLTTICGEPFLFDTWKDCADFKTKLKALLTAARDKE